MSKVSETVCDFCMSTGIVSATLVKQDDEEGISRQHHIDVVLCGGHFGSGNSEKNIAVMEKGSGLPVNVVGVKQPQDSQES